MTIDCKYWDESAQEWSTEGVTTVVAADGKSVACETLHLTTFGGIVKIPTSAEALLKELEAAFKFNFFTLDEMFSLLSNFRRALPSNAVSAPPNVWHNHRFASWPPFPTLLSPMYSTSFADNLTVMLTLIITTTINFVCVACLGFYRDYRARITRQREEKMSADEKV